MLFRSIATTNKDRQQLETDETNNTTFAPIEIKAALRTDLIIDSVTTTATGTSGENIDVTWRVKNQGELITRQVTSIFSPLVPVAVVVTESMIKSVWSAALISIGAKVVLFVSSVSSC